MQMQMFRDAPFGAPIALVRFDDWFVAPDGQQYQYAYGPVQVIEAKDVLGRAPRGSADWYMQVGAAGSAVLLAGCRIHVVSQPGRCPKHPAIYDTTGGA